MPKLAGAPSVSESVAGTVPPTPLSVALDGVTAPSPAKRALVVPAGTSTQPPLPAVTVVPSPSAIGLVGKPSPLSRLTRQTRPSLSWSFDGAGMPGGGHDQVGLVGLDPVGADGPGRQELGDLLVGTGVVGVGHHDAAGVVGGDDRLGRVLVEARAEHPEDLADLVEQEVGSQVSRL